MTKTRIKLETGFSELLSYASNKQSIENLKFKQLFENKYFVKLNYRKHKKCFLEYLNDAIETNFILLHCRNIAEQENIDIISNDFKLYENILEI
ncbi:MAG: hypothetical protein J6Q87_07670 [Clostridia bacterium]|nr:hypothetical protein [Clostridia bacterium]